MKFIQTSMYDIWSETTDELLRIQGLKKDNYEEEGKKAWGLIMKYAHHLKDTGATKATAAFWAVWGSCQVSYKEVAEKFTETRQTLIFYKSGTQLEETVTAERIKSLVNDAKDRIREGLDLELELLKKRYARKKGRT